MSYSPLLALPPELREQIYSFLFHPATHTTEHPFPRCFPSSSRFKPYTTTCLVNKLIYSEVEAFFAKKIAPRTSLYLTTVTALRHYQALARTNPILQKCTFHLRANSTTNRTSSAQTGAEAEEALALMRLQPGCEARVEQIHGFKAVPPSHPRHRAKHVSLSQTGGEICDSPRCRQRARGHGHAIEVQEQRYQAGKLSLCDYVWWEPGRPWEELPRTLVCLEGKLGDVWVPEENAVKVYLKRRSERVV